MKELTRGQLETIMGRPLDDAQIAILEHGSLVNIDSEREDVERVRTGLVSLDWALRDSAQGIEGIGVPATAIWDIHGENKSGKSTLAYFVASTLAELGVYLADLEGVNLHYIEQVFRYYQGTVRVPGLMREEKGKKKHAFHEDILGDGVIGLGVDWDVMIHDSVSATAPRAELSTLSSKNPDWNAANMGQRAKLIATLLRTSLGKIMGGTHSRMTYILINHLYDKVASPRPGKTVAGGQAVQNFPMVRLRAWRTNAGQFYQEKDDTASMSEEAKNDNHDDDYIMNLNVVKHRFGGAGRTAEVAMLAGIGVHKGLSALWLCKKHKLAKHSGVATYVGDVSTGISRREYIRIAKTGDDHSEVWFPFYALLAEYEQTYFTNEEIGDTIIATEE